MRKENESSRLDQYIVFEFKNYTGGTYETNCFLVEAPQGRILFDAAEGVDLHFGDEKIDLLVLTHGHWDHITDAAAIKKRHGCPVVCHADTVPMITEGDFFEKHGFPLRVEVVEPDRVVGEGKAQDFLGLSFDLLDVPGHCPGSLCFYAAEAGALIGGDVLFRGGIGRWDLPGGDGELLLQKIREKILPLPEATVVFPGHGPSTTIGEEKLSNPFLRPS